MKTHWNMALTGLALALNGAVAQAQEQGYGLQAIWAQGDAVAKGTFLILLVMSLSSWWVVVVKFLEQHRAMQSAQQAHQALGSHTGLTEVLTGLPAHSPHAFVGHKALEAVAKYASAQHRVEFNVWVSMIVQSSIQSVQAQLQTGLSVLATVGSTAPFVGLFGTVWGIYHALVKIGLTGQASIDKVAGPVGESLIMTAIGLAVAVPAVLGYNWLARRNKRLVEDLQAFGDEVHQRLLMQPADMPSPTR
jgi:biopolymer transport protein ExbB